MGEDGDADHRVKACIREGQRKPLPRLRRVHPWQVFSNPSNIVGVYVDANIAPLKPLKHAGHAANAHPEVEQIMVVGQRPGTRRRERPRDIGAMRRKVFDIVETGRAMHQSQRWKRRHPVARAD